MSLPLTSEKTRELAERTQTTPLIVNCALTPCHEWRAVRAVGKAKVEEIQRAARELAKETA